MKKTIIVYNAFTFVACFIISIVDIIISGVKTNVLIITFLSVLLLIPIYFILEKKFLKKSLLALAIANLIQSFSFIFFGLTYKLIFGPDLSLYLINSDDNIMKLSFKVFNISSYFNYIEDDNTLLIGINFIHLLMFISFYLEAKKLKE